MAPATQVFAAQASPTGTTHLQADAVPVDEARKGVVPTQPALDLRLAAGHQRDFEAEDTRIQASIDLAERYCAVLAAEDELALGALRRQVKRQTASAFLTMNAEPQRIKATRVAVEPTTAATRSAQEVYKRGINTSTDVLYSIREEFRARRDLQQAQ
ncbi:hypothetical protein KSS94_20430 [Pseudomonas fakonensis]|uniref:Uncharacterized protein n=1 Tax=Pseudomonas fakonensis TaxID=2842355 RepID=A0ABX8N385_9PSED|nr:hypothetical protein [Pseudomonas fakonensis]QXH50295.1 hypothetical protein KSS94_20430 [Pseudomonas fakonensis]